MGNFRNRKRKNVKSVTKAVTRVRSRAGLSPEELLKESKRLIDHFNLRPGHHNLNELFKLIQEMLLFRKRNLRRYNEFEAIEFIVLRDLNRRLWNCDNCNSSMLIRPGLEYLLGLDYDSV